MPPRLAQLLQLVGWDGLLPLLMAAGPIVVKMTFPNPPLAAGVALVLAPPLAALVRAHIGWGQIAKRCGGRAPFPRQVAMAAAILLLFVFESAVSILTFEDKIPASAWWVPIATYAGYLIVISYALRSEPEDPCPACASIASLDIEPGE